MKRSLAISGVVVQSTEPRWEPLEAVFDTDIAGCFMWMYEIRLDDGTRLHAFKHVTTRRYLHLAEDGRAFEYRFDGRYREVRLAPAIGRAFVGWERTSPPPRHLRALRTAVAAARSRAA
jgi:hypothetical protein